MPAPGGSEINPAVVRGVCERLVAGKPVRRKLAPWGTIHIDRPLPFLCLYRRPPGSGEQGTHHLLTAEASYLIAVGDHPRSLRKLVSMIVGTLVEQFGACLLLELWSGPAEQDGGSELAATPPSFRILVSKGDDPGRIVETLGRTLSGITVGQRSLGVEIRPAGRPGPACSPPILSAAAGRALGCHLLGLEVPPIYRDPRTGEPYPVLLNDLRRQLSHALRPALFDFSCQRTTRCPRHHHVLGPRAVVKAVWEVDRKLAEVADRLPFLMQVTPINVEEAWRGFRRSCFERAPIFHYRPLGSDPVVLKRSLYATPIERVEDPALAQLLREKQDELDRQITMLSDLNTPRFRYGSVQLYGQPGSDLVRLAEDLLDRLPPRARDDSRQGYLDAASFARLARAEIDHYRRQWPQLRARIEVRDDLYRGLLVSEGTLLIGQQTRIPAARAEALLQHEVGTHLLTYHNARAQPLRQLYSGLAGYDALQEGLAVLAEYLVGGLSRPRLRLLAARVVAVRDMLAGASFVETFRKLDRDYDFARRTAFTVTMRVYRGGGFSKDAAYLEGLCQVLRYLAQEGEIEPLFVGKIAVAHIALVSELKWRGVLRSPPLSPRYLSRPETAARLEHLRRGASVPDLIERR